MNQTNNLQKVSKKMYFTQITRYREIECIKRQIPNFSPRGHGSMVLKSEMQILSKENEKG